MDAPVRHRFEPSWPSRPSARPGQYRDSRRISASLVACGAQLGTTSLIRSGDARRNTVEPSLFTPSRRQVQHASYNVFIHLHMFTETAKVQRCFVEHRHSGVKTLYGAAGARACSAEGVVRSSMEQALAPSWRRGVPANSILPLPRLGAGVGGGAAKYSAHLQHGLCLFY